MISSRIVVQILAAGVAFGSFTASCMPKSADRDDKQQSGVLSTGKVPKTQISMNVPALRAYQSTVAFQNLVFGDAWKDSKWKELPVDAQTAVGGIPETSPGQPLYHFLSIPSTMQPGTIIRCTYDGSGKLGVGGGGRLIFSKPGSMELETKVGSNEHASIWVNLRDVSRDRPFENLNCHQKSATAALFRPEFVKTMLGYPVIRFMDWQNSNANSPVTWATRHHPGDTRNAIDGVAIEDMMALANEVKASPWFVMPWNADDAYIAGFAQLVAHSLPADKSVYVETGNEVWNTGFPVTRQAQQEGLQLKLADNPTRAGLLRYAQRTVQVMKIWESAFKGRKGLVRVVSSQHVQPRNAELLFSAPELADHTDAYATAPYFGRTMGGPVSREAAIADLAAQLPVVERTGLQNKEVAQKYGKRYIAYEGGQGLALPANVAELREVENSPEMYAFYKSFLQWWKRDIGDTLCLYTRTGLPGPSGAWGITEHEDDGPDKSVKLKALLEER